MSQPCPSLSNWCTDALYTHGGILSPAPVAAVWCDATLQPGLTSPHLAYT